MPLHVSSTSAHRQEAKTVFFTVSGIIKPIGGRPVHGTATYRCDDTRDCIVQFWPPDDEHLRSKHVEV
jgi:hypothetical protein